jgi:hypothetical protein
VGLEVGTGGGEVIDQISARLAQIKLDTGINILVLSTSGNCSVIGMRSDDDRFYVAKRTPEKPTNATVLMRTIDEVYQEIRDELDAWVALQPS